MRVIVTGASKGIGRGIATYLAKQGYSVGLLARSQSLLDELRNEIIQDGGKAESIDADLRDPNRVEEAIDGLVNILGGIDALINNAGLVIRKDVFSLSPSEWTAMMETNVNGLFYCTQSALRYMKKQQSGHIINISSISGYVPLPGGSGYAASKYAVTGFSESLFHEVRDFNIKVSTVFPGSVDSESHRHDAEQNHSWKISPEEVGQACFNILNTEPGNCISRVEIRPLKRPVKK
ncbi:MAG: SDR family NAD(P)-dependent oxidoreductase [Candidatus Hinthialibacter antarcticus]|nr:SDR family NAD(P)-dependent oxidoreductase [Candidatus Hinthialibacter antarcticus]